VLNLKKEISDYSLLIKNSLSTPLINLINEEIYSNIEHWGKGAVGDVGEKNHIRSVKVTSFDEKDIGASISKRIIFNELKKFVPQLEDAYREKVSKFYFSDKNYFQFLYYDDEMQGHYVYHVDNSCLNPRNLTILVGLNSKDEYEGGELFVANQEKGVKLDKGDVVCFPSNFMFPHKVERVRKGQRKVLIIWTQ
jgi:predicted 2-oxoglutarate/Fe(II)-dependent dioxygenase YbiX|tara:strand:+ start:739 stop:1320 length:582 start_codon:yes stop_codon:yes gene_type:complete